MDALGGAKVKLVLEKFNMLRFWGCILTGEKVGESSGRWKRDRLVNTLSVSSFRQINRSNIVPLLLLSH